MDAKVTEKFMLLMLYCLINDWEFNVKLYLSDDKILKISLLLAATLSSQWKNIFPHMFILSSYTSNNKHYCVMYFYQPLSVFFPPEKLHIRIKNNFDQ